MSDPTFSAIMITYGRHQEVEEAIACYEKQTLHHMRHELIVLNTFPKQKFSTEWNHGCIRLVNCSQRPPSLGEARNMAIREAAGDIIVIADDDDRWTSRHLERFAEAFKPDIDWVWQSRQFYMEGNRIKAIVQGSCPVFAFRKRAWEAVGGYPALSVGEDRALITAITQKFKGVRLETSPEDVTFIYRWGQGVYHCSGLGDDRPGQPLAHDRFAAHIENLVKCGSVPTGDIVLKPHLNLDYEQLAKDYVANLEAGSKKNDCCIVLLGRYGDIINALPIAQHVHEKFATPYWMVSSQFADIFDGVSYVKPYVVDLPNDHLEDALKIARRDFPHVLQAQIWGGPQYPQERLTESFNMESWRNCGFLHEFKNKDWHPVFDRRDAKREQAIVARLAGQKPKLLVNTTTSSSSPFQYGRELLDAIIQRCSDKYQVVNMGEHRFHRIYDVLGLFENSAALVSIDTALLHLAGATGIPVIALVNDKPWLGSVPRANVVARIPYGYGAVEAAVKAIGELR